ncbi:MAG: hypothetical protein ACOYOV_07570 [Bacteroidales bacterium]
MAVKNSELVAFFEELAKQHKKIDHSDLNKHFYRMELDEFASGVNNFIGYNMIMEVIPFGYDGSNRDNSFKTREVSFMVVKSIKEVNKAAKSLAFDECESIVDDILSKLNNARCGFNGTIITFDPNGVDGHQVTDGKNYGIRCIVEVKSKHNFEVVSANWKDVII